MLFFFQRTLQIINTLCGQNVEFFSVKPGGTKSNHYALKRSFQSSDFSKIFDSVYDGWKYC
jgi:hypothetical protein